MRESELLAHIYARSAGAMPPGVLVGPGDDAAVVEFGGRRVIATVDQLVEGRHYDPESTPVDLIARKAIARSVSDIAAMGGRPTCALAAASLPADCRFADDLFDSMARWAQHWTCPLVGGDIATTAGPVVLSVTALGEPHAVRGPVLRSGARAGDGVYVTGALGGSLASGRHLTFEPRLAVAAALCGALGGRLRAMIDLSDGHGRDAGRVAVASGVRIALDAASLPLHDGVTDWRSAAADGEDYELLFTAEGAAPGNVAGVTITRIGVVLEGRGCVVRTPDGAEIDAGDLGWDHGAS